MKAGAVCWELSIELSEEEIKSLFNNSLDGKIRVYDRNEKLGDKDLQIRVGEINNHQINAELRTIPEKVYIDSVIKYTVILSKDGYDDLIRNGSTGDRMYANSGCKVRIYRKGLEV